MTKLHPLRVLLCATLVLPACVADDASTSDDPADDDTATATDSVTVTAARAYAPACIARPVHHFGLPVGPSEGWVDLKNNCGKTMHVKVVLSLGSDTDCMTMKAGATKQVIWWSPTDYDYTITC